MRVAITLKGVQEVEGEEVGGGGEQGDVRSERWGSKGSEPSGVREKRGQQEEGFQGWSFSSDHKKNTA